MPKYIKLLLKTMVYIVKLVRVTSAEIFANLKLFLMVESSIVQLENSKELIVFDYILIKVDYCNSEESPIEILLTFRSLKSPARLKKMLF